MRTLKVKCPTWQHVETFYERKLRKDNTLTLRVPFDTEEGAQVALGLQLPNNEMVSIEGTVIGLVPGDPGQRDAARLFLHGMNESLLHRLRAMVADGMGGRAIDRQPAAPPPPSAQPESAPQWVRSTPPARPARDQSQPAARAPSAPPVSLPEDAPVDEVVEPPIEPSVQNVSEYERNVFLELDAELDRLRQCAAHEVLGVAEDADVAQIRTAYFALTKRYHPDIYARHRSRALLSMAQELFIHINKAYDRMRDALVAAGRAIVAGPALLPHDGWLAGLDDMAAGDDMAAVKAAPHRAFARAPTGGGASGGGNHDIEREVAALLDADGFEAAREKVASALHFDPRNRRLRALYHVISGRERLATGETMAAATQFEAALAHDRDCRPAREALDHMQARGHHSGMFPRSSR